MPFLTDSIAFQSDRFGKRAGQEFPAGVGGASAFVWSGVNKNARVTLTAGGRAANSDANDIVECGRMDTPLTGKVYFELLYTAGGGNANGGGFCNSSLTFPDNGTLTETANGIGYDCVGVIRSNAGTVATIEQFFVGETACFAIDVPGNKWWARRNGNGWLNDIIANQNPATGTGGLALTIPTAGGIFLAYQMENLSGTNPATLTIPAARAFTPPVGFTSVS